MKLGTLVIADEHLGKCEIEKCRYQSDGICCFAGRADGCIQQSIDVEQRASMDADMATLFEQTRYDCDLKWAAETRKERESFLNTINGTPIQKMATEVSDKTYNFIYKGHEYTFEDGTSDYVSCPHCGAKDKESLGFYSEGKNRIACFECNRCFENFYYHDPDIKVSEPVKLDLKPLKL